METYIAPPFFNKKTWEIVGPHALTGSRDPNVGLTGKLHPNNGVLLAGGAAAGKTTAANALASGGPDLAHTPTAALFRKEYEVAIDPSRRGEDPMFFETQTISEYIAARVEGIIEMIQTIKRLKRDQLYDGDQIIIGGAMQSLISLFVYCNKCYNPGNEYRLPDEAMKIMVLLFQQWSPSVLVYVDARKEVREARAREQDRFEPGSFNKRQLAFAFDRELREVTLHTMREIAHIARQNGEEIPLLYLSTDCIDLPTPEGFTRVTDIEDLQGIVGNRLKHIARDYMWARFIENTWDD